MLYTEFTVNNKDYKARLTTQSIIDLEKKLGSNLLQVLVDMEQTGKLPEIQTLLIILHASLQKFHHGMKFEDVMNLYDEYTDQCIEDGSSEPAINCLIKLIYQIFVDSGLLPKAEDTKVEEEKN